MLDQSQPRAGEVATRDAAGRIVKRKPARFFELTTRGHYALWFLSFVFVLMIAALIIGAWPFGGLGKET